MELILWRHGRAVDGTPDATRKLSKSGADDVARVGAWLRARLDADAVTVLSSPTVRTRATAEALGLSVRTLDGLGPDASADDALALAGWPDGNEGVVIVVGHQPWIGRAAGRLLTGGDAAWTIAPGAFWWFGWAKGAARPTPELKAALTPELLR
jgi:phosphohistidine phosphatase